MPAWLVAALREHLGRYPLGEADLIFANQVGGSEPDLPKRVGPTLPWFTARGATGRR
jgi:hypothetical protein